MYELPKSYITKTISFLRKVNPDRKKMLIYHGDVDGCTSAAVFALSIKERFEWSFDNVYWVGTDEYDFVDMKKHILDISPDYIFFLDLNVLENEKVLRDILEKTKAKIFIFDHHISSKDVKDKDILYLNPTPDTELNKKQPIPACVFSHNIYKFLGNKNASWITGAGIIGEGMVKHYEKFFSKVAFKFPNLVADDITKSKLARISSLIYANFIGRIKENIAFNLLIEAGEQENPWIFLGTDGNVRKLSILEQDIKDEVSWFFRNSMESMQKIPVLNLLIAKIRSKYRIDGLISNILKEEYPDKIILLYSFYKDKVLIELKTGRGDVDFSKIIKNICNKVHCLSGGGHSMAAGAMVRGRDLNLFIEEFKRELKNR